MIAFASPSFSFEEPDQSLGNSWCALSIIAFCVGNSSVWWSEFIAAANSLYSLVFFPLMLAWVERESRSRW